MGRNYYRSSRREKWVDVVSVILIAVAMIAGIIIGIGVGYVGRAGLVDEIKAQQAVIDELKEEIETKAFFGYPRNLKLRGV